MSTTAVSIRSLPASTLFVIVIALTPALMVLIPWDFGNEMNAYRGFMRGNSLPVTILELVFVLLAMMKGFSPTASVRLLPTSSKVGILLFVIVSIWTTIFVAASPLTAILGLIKLFAHAVFALAIADQFTRCTIEQRKYIWPAVGIGVIGFCILWSVNIMFFNPRGDDWVWFVPTLTNIRWVGFFALASFCAGVGSIVISKTGKVYRTKIALPLLFMIIGCFLAMWTATRGAILAITIAAAVGAYFSKDWKSVAGLALAAAVLAGMAAFVSPNVHPSYGMERLFSTADQYSNLNGLSSGRLQIWLATLQKIGVHPWIGWGIDQFRFSGPEATLGLRHPHQSVLQLLFATGIIGAIALMLIIAPILKFLPFDLPTPTHWGAMAYLMAGTVYGLHDGFYHYTYPVMLYLISIAILMTFRAVPAASDKSD